jgi:cell division protein FtsQ
VLRIGRRGASQVPDDAPAEVEAVEDPAPPEESPPPGPRRRWRRRLLLVLVPVLLVAALLAAATSMRSPMTIRSVEVVGAAPELAPAVTTAAGVAPGQSFASVDARAVAGRVGAIDGVESASVRWSWWNTLQISVVERRVVAARAAEGGAVVLLDERGEPVRTVPAKPAEIVLVAGQGPGREIAIATAAELPEPWVPRIATLVGEGPRSVVLELASGQRVDLGDATELLRKLALAEPLLATGAKSVDVSVPERPALRDVPPPAPAPAPAQP